MLDVVGGDAHAMADMVEGGLEGGRCEEGKASVGPLLAHETLRLQRGRPIYRAAAAPGLSSEDGNAVIVAHFRATVLEEVKAAVNFSHGQMLGWVVVGFFNHKDVETSFGEVLRADGASTATADNHYISLNNFGGFSRREPDEIVVMAFARIPMNWCSGETQNGSKSWACLGPYCFEENGKCL